MAYINDELNNNVRGLFDLLFYRYDSSDIPIGTCYIEVGKNIDLPHTHELGICDFIVSEQDNNLLVIDISSFKLGIIIGNRGHLIGGIRNYLKEKLNKEIKINLFESKMFYTNDTKRYKIMDSTLCY